MAHEIYTIDETEPPDRKGVRPLDHLKNFTGTLHADAYSGYNQLYINDEQSSS